MAKISIIGTGTWGVALAILLQRNGHQVTAWSKFQKEIDGLDANRIHPNLPGAVIPKEIQFTCNIEEACSGQDMLVLSVPSIFTRETARLMNPYIQPGQIIVNVAKGIEESTLMTLSQIIEEEVPQAEVTVLSGPSHAEEVGRGIPTTIVVGANNKKTAEDESAVFFRL